MTAAKTFNKWHNKTKLKTSLNNGNRKKKRKKRYKYEIAIEKNCLSSVTFNTILERLLIDTGIPSRAWLLNENGLKANDWEAEMIFSKAFRLHFVKLYNINYGIYFLAFYNFIMCFVIFCT